jgi:hypothetical protein
MSVQDDKAASALAACRAAEAKIGEVQRLLRDPRPETLDRAMADLAEVAAVLNTLAGSARQAGAQKWNPAALASFHQIRLAARALRPQMEHASKFCLGWIQIRRGTGYTRQGSPVLVESEATSSFEG